MRLTAITLSILAIGVGAASAQGLQRNYGTTGYGTGGIGYGAANNPYNNPATTPGTGRSFSGVPAPATADQPAAASTSSDYDRVMNAVNNSSAAGQPATDDSDANADPNADTTTQPATAQPNSSNGQNGINRGAVATGAGGLPGSNGGFTTPTGTVGLGAYNRSPYAAGFGSGTTTPTAAPGPVTPTYTGQQ